jgi:hypothetical protein
MCNKTIPVHPFASDSTPDLPYQSSCTISVQKSCSYSLPSKGNSFVIFLGMQALLGIRLESVEKLAKC